MPSFRQLPVVTAGGIPATSAPFPDVATINGLRILVSIPASVL
jgi:hypothetical protein